MSEETKELTIDTMFEEAMKPMASPAEKESIETETEKQGPEETKEIPEQVPAVEKIVYTDDEFKTINFDQIDTERIPEKFKQSYEFAKDKAKNLEKAYNQKYMELAEQRKQYDYDFQQQKQAATNPQSWLIQEFEKNPQSTVRELDDEIITRKNELEMLKIDTFTNPLAEDIEQKKAMLIQKHEDIVKLEYYRRGIDQYSSQKTFAMQQNQRLQEAEALITGQVIDEIRKEFPEFDKKRNEIGEFAKTNIGYSNAQIYLLTNPVRLSLSHRIPIEEAKQMARSNYNTIIKLYNYEQMIVKGKNKIKQTPQTLTKAGPVHETKSSDDMSFDELDKHLTSLGV